MRLGKHQLDLLAGMAHVGACLIVPNDVSRSLCKRGLMRATSDKTPDGFIIVTPDGFRALADAMDAGLVSYIPDWEAVRQKRVAT